MSYPDPQADPQADSPTLPPPAPTASHPVRRLQYFQVSIALMRDRAAFVAEVGRNQQLPTKLAGLLVSSSLFLVAYGLIIGSIHSPLQALSSAIKLPVLYLLAIAVCFPTLYIFNCFIGSRQSFLQHCTLVLAATNIIALLMLGFFPVSLFFRLTADDPILFKLLNVAILGLTGAIGTLFLQGSILNLEEKQRHRLKRQAFLTAWLFLYGFIGCQLAWHLSPFFGTTGEPFMLFGDSDSGNFLTGILGDRTIDSHPPRIPVEDGTLDRIDKGESP